MRRRRSVSSTARAMRSASVVLRGGSRAISRGSPGVTPSRTASFRVALPSAVLLGALAPPVAAFEFTDLFRTPEQRAAARFESGEHEALVDDAPDAAWEGIGRYAGGDARGAADAFTRALDAEAASPEAARNALLYNRATAETRAGRLDEAIALYDELLERDPEHEDGRHNRDVARALQALDEQQGSSSDGEPGDGESEEGGESSEGGDGQRGEDGSASDGQDTGDAEAGEEGGERDGSSSGDEGDAAAGGRSDGAGSDEERNASDADGSVTPDEAAAAEARAAAEAALEAERERAASGEARAARAPGEARTPTEREQATEQWLRRIPDDPSGLLRRRLERSHGSDYPEVGDGDEPW